MRYYLSPTRMYPASMFRDVFRGPIILFQRILGDFVAFNSRRWSTRTDALGRRGIRAEDKVLGCIRLIGSARSLRDLDDGAKMGKETIRRYLAKFYHNIGQLYGISYLTCRPTTAELGAIEHG